MLEDPSVTCDKGILYRDLLYRYSTKLISLCLSIMVFPYFSSLSRAFRVSVSETQHEITLEYTKVFLWTYTANWGHPVRVGWIKHCWAATGFNYTLTLFVVKRDWKTIKVAYFFPVWTWSFFLGWFFYIACIFCKSIQVKMRSFFMASFGNGQDKSNLAL